MRVTPFLDAVPRFLEAVSTQKGFQRFIALSVL